MSVLLLAVLGPEELALFWMYQVSAYTKFIFTFTPLVEHQITNQIQNEKSGDIKGMDFKTHTVAHPRDA